MKLLFDQDCEQYPTITSHIYYKGDSPNPHGIFSEVIFGTTRKERSSQYAVIELNCEIIHPFILQMFSKSYRKETEMVLSLQPFIFKDKKIIPSATTEKGVLFGIPGLRRIFLELLSSEKEGSYATKIRQIIKKYNNRFTISKVIVIPPAFREYVKGKELSAINQLYNNILIYASNVNAAEGTYQYAQQVNYVQKGVLELFHFVQQQAPTIMRDKILSKIVDFSARSVITGDLTLKANQIGVPLKILVKLAEPFIIHEARVEDPDLNVDEFKLLLQKINKGILVSQKELSFVKKVTERAIEGRKVLAKRDPALHKLSWQAFYPVIVDDDTIHLYSLAVEGFNADFDGDQMALYMPLSQESQQEVNQMFNIYNPANPNSRTKYSFDKDFKLGICLATSDPAPMTTELPWFWKKVTVDKQNTTGGREAVYNVFKGKIPINKIGHVTDVNTLIAKFTNIPEEELIEIIDGLKDIALKTIEAYTISVNLDDLKIPDSVKKIIEQLKKKDANFDQISKDVKTTLLKYLADSKSGMSYLLECGVLRDTNYVQMLGVKGTTLDIASGKLTNIHGNFSEGLSPTDYFSAANASRAAVAARSIKTSIPGYLARKLVFAISGVTINPTVKDCGTTRTLRLYVTPDMESKILNRFAYIDGKLTLITRDNVKSILNKNIELRSPIYCKNKEICEHCYGLDYKYNGKQIGFVAAEAIAERMTQQIMRVFHTGGVTTRLIINPLKENLEITGETPKFLQYDEKTHKLITKLDATLVLEKSLYNLRFSNELEEIQQEMIIGEIRQGETTYSLVIPTNVLLFLTDVKNSTEEIEINYKAGEAILEVLPSTSEAESKIKQIMSIVEGRSKYKEVEHFISQLYKSLLFLGDVSLVHLEVITSQLFRDKSNPSIPARLASAWNPQIYAVKQIPYLESWVRGLEFERFQDAIANALTNEEASNTDSILDQAYLSDTIT
jgi:DNA-directed RNA polymerase beta' subunit